MTVLKSADKQIDISFIVPCYNIDEYIERCIDSILKIADDINYEIICIDDCSTDNTVEVIKKYEGNSHIRLIENDVNLGVSETRNVGINAAIGEFIWFVDADDMIVADAARIFLDLARKESVPAVFGNFLEVADDTETAVTDNNELETKRVTIGTGDSYYARNSMGHSMEALWYGIWNSSFLRNNGLYFKKDILYWEDVVFHYEFQLYATQVIKTNVLCYNYRIRSASMLHSFNETRNLKVYKSNLAMYELYISFLEQGRYLPGSKEGLVIKIQALQQSCVIALARLKDKKFIKEQLKIMKKEKIYPYPCRKFVWQSPGGFFKKLMMYLLPFRPVFWLTRRMFLRRYRTSDE